MPTEVARYMIGLAGKRQYFLVGEATRALSNATIDGLKVRINLRMAFLGLCGVCRSEGDPNGFSAFGYADRGGLVADWNRQGASAQLGQDVLGNASTEVREAGFFSRLRHDELEEHVPHLCVPLG